MSRSSWLKETGCLRFPTQHYASCLRRPEEIVGVQMDMRLKRTGDARPTQEEKRDNRGPFGYSRKAVTSFLFQSKRVSRTASPPKSCPAISRRMIRSLSVSNSPLGKRRATSCHPDSATSDALVLDE